MKLFAEGGYDATGVAAICDTAGVSKGAFYHHFETKQAVFLILLEDWLQGVETHLLDAMKGAETVPDALMQMAARTQEVFQAADGRLSIFLEFWDQARHEPEIWKKAIAPFRRYREIFAKIIARGIEEGSFRPVDPDFAEAKALEMPVGGAG